MHVRNLCALLIILVPAGLGEAADTMIELCVRMRGLGLNIYVGIILRYKILR
jgi:hypothetical protein